MPQRRDHIIKQARERIARVQASLNAMDYLCSGTLLRRMKVCGKPGCRCAEDPGARHGPYYEWGHMKGGKLVHRMITPEQAALLRRAIVNYRKAKKLMKAWENETERLFDNEAPHDLNAHENEPTCAQFGGPTECAGKSNGRVVFRVVNGLVDWKREAHASALMGMTGPFAWPR